MDGEPTSSFCESCDSPIETMEELRPDSYESLKEQLQQAEAEITSLNEQTRLLKENLQKLEEQIERLSKENEDLKSHRFCLENMTDDDSISFHTGFPNMAAFQATLAYLNPMARTCATGAHPNVTFKKTIMMRIIKTKKASVDEVEHLSRKKNFFWLCVDCARDFMDNTWHFYSVFPRLQ